MNHIGTASLVASHSAVASDAVICPSECVPCHKETGSGSHLRKWSRSHQFIVRGGGHIDTWQSLHRYVDQLECHRLIPTIII